MATGRISNGGWLAVGLAVVAGLLALANVIVIYQRSGDISWGKLALAFGVPIFIYASVRGRGNGSSKS